jgi:phage repressor protein C with HTH and peptisase S24 domain
MRSELGPVEELASQLLKGGAPLRIKARGGSMIPFILDGDVVLVAPSGNSAILLGDVICYEISPGRLFLHRVIRRDGERFVTKGDALDFTDLVSPAQVLGKVVAIERRGRIRRLDTARWRNRGIAFLSPLLSGLLPVAMRVRRIWMGLLRG